MKKALTFAIIFSFLITNVCAVVYTDNLNCGNDICEAYENVFESVGDTDTVTVEGVELNIELVNTENEQGGADWNVNGVEGSMPHINNEYLLPYHGHFDFSIRLSDYTKYDVSEYLGEAVYMKEEQYCLLDCVGDPETDNTIEELALYPGWNLINMENSMLRRCILVPDNEICEEDILASYMYVPSLKEYVNLKTIEEDYSQSELGAISREINDLTSMFIYLEESAANKGLPITIFESQANEVEPVQLNEGWNFISITQQMREKTFSQLIGDCNIEKMHSFESIVQEWSPNLIEDSYFMNQETIGNSAVGQGLIVKVAEECTFGTSSGGDGMSPPPVPNGL